MKKVYSLGPDGVNSAMNDMFFGSDHTFLQFDILFSLNGLHYGTFET